MHILDDLFEDIELGSGLLPRDPNVSLASGNSRDP
jgi:hypothetical protein